MQKSESSNACAKDDLAPISKGLFLSPPNGPNIPGRIIPIPRFSSSTSSTDTIQRNPCLPSICCKLCANRSASSSPLGIMIRNCWPPWSISMKFISSSLVTSLSSRWRSAAKSLPFVTTSSCSSAAISDIAEELMPSSKTNKQTVHIASIATPPITSHVAVLWTSAEYFGYSKSMPAPTEIDANTLADMSTKWGQNGLTEPENRALRVVSILAILGWLFATAAAFFRLAQSLRICWRERHPRRN